MFMRLVGATSITGLMLAVLISPVALAREKERIIYGAEFEKLEYFRAHEGNGIGWEGSAFAGNDNVRFFVDSEGEYQTSDGHLKVADNRAYAKIPLSPFFDGKIGARLQNYGGGARWYGMAGIEGLAPQWFEVDLDFFLSDAGDASARLEAEYELLFTNYFYIVAVAESTYAFAADHEAKSGTGINDLELGLRLHYDLIDRSVSPYVGTVYEARYGDTADLHSEDEDSEWIFVAGVKLKL